ncbi:hypothetical protein PIB30_037610 [Stylosanthes scabra]|uniref:Uncharacterized protein n=1 Tax=Stylosanthes scabra TaxID=79078 RepID=A0ABU6ZBZ0_9FABA|nr:hypothetical protein [Stylosanthes scabra]
MFQRPRSIALEYEKPGTYGTVLIYPLDRLVECGFAEPSFARNINYLDSPTTIPSCFQRKGNSGLTLLRRLGRTLIKRSSVQVESDIVSRFLLEEVPDQVQQGPRLAHFCPSSETSFLGRSSPPPPSATGNASSCSRLVSSSCTESSLISMTTFSSDTGLVTLYSAASLRDLLHGILVSLLEELSPAILKFCHFFGGRVDVTAPFSGTSGVGVGICTAMFDRNAASLGEARVGG